MKKALAVIFSLFLLCGFTHGRGPQTYQVSNSGSDSNDGLSEPWATPGKVNSSSFNSGDTVEFDGTSTFAAGLALTQANAPSNLTITSYNSGQPTFNTGSSTACVTATDLAGLNISNLNCVGGGDTTNSTEGIRVENSLAGGVELTGPTISGVTVSGYGQACIDVLGNNALSGFTGDLITSSTLHDCDGNTPSPNGSSACIQIGAGPSSSFVKTISTNVTVSSLTVYNCIGTAGLSFPSGDGILVNLSTIVTASHNVVHNTGSVSTASSGPVGLIFYELDQGVMEFNEVYDSFTSGGDGENMDFDGGVTNSIAQYNYMHGAAANSYFILGDFTSLTNSNNTVRFNTIESASGIPGFGFSCGNSGHGCTSEAYYNNTIYSAATMYCINGGETNSASVTINFSNNICDNPGGQLVDFTGTTTLTFTGNDTYDGSGSSGFSATINSATYTSLSTFQTAGFEKVSGSPVGTTANPHLSSPGGAATCGGYAPPCPSGYELSNASPAGKGTGLNLNSIYSFSVGSQDFYGNALTNTTLPIGAAGNM